MSPSGLQWESFGDDGAPVVGAAPARPDAAAQRKEAPARAPGGKGGGRRAAPAAKPARRPEAPAFRDAEGRADPPPAAATAGEPEAALGGPTQQQVEALVARARGEGRAAGFEEGVAHAEARGQAALRVILSDLAEQLADALHARVEQEKALERMARQLAEALLAGVAPAFARQGLAAEVAAAATEALRSARAAADPGTLRVRVGAAQADAVRAALAAGGLAAEVEADPTLSDLAARLDWAEGEDRIDLDSALAGARAALDRHLPAPERRLANG